MSASAGGGRSHLLAGRLLTPMILEEKPICRAAITRLVSDRAEFGPPHLAASLAEAIEVIANVKPDLLLLDLFSIGYDFKGLERLKSLHPSTITIAIDDRMNPAFARLSKDAGADGYACKAFEIEQFQAVISEVISGMRSFPADILGTPSNSASAGSTAGLSPRQMEVLKCIAAGMSNQEIANTLGITLGTVKLHTHAVLRITGTRNRTEAALIAGRFIAPILED
ncbi:response regulator transcription factor [Phenylobacterium sp. LH3H17]|uniref:LuxR C-terminal-related transcriptional regulator n=1 Tax=Phenylobacterium sp. LH3H17 TaxID=2903901 RepID=UPI0020CA2224|nr:response regulator transcription factor [Phenylobacterium sp. LH3H17]UTP38249.1 response regulator transcription factor [Phenylobacterium sp. LH3H17]